MLFEPGSGVRTLKARAAVRPAGLVCLVLGLGGMTLGCGGKQQEGPSEPGSAHVRRSTKIELEPCAVAESAGLDANGDGRAEVGRAMSGGREACRVADLNGDGRPDRTTFFDSDGRLRRVESDFDRDGRIDEIALYAAGVLQEKHRATLLGGKLDTWEFYEGGALVRTERDKNGDGIIDQWWEYPRPGCPLIHTDSDGDGRPDPHTTIDYCQATGYVPPEEIRPRPAAETRSFESEGTQVTEIREVSSETEGASEEKGAQGAPDSESSSGQSEEKP